MNTIHLMPASDSRGRMRSRARFIQLLAVLILSSFGLLLCAHAVAAEKAKVLVILSSAETLDLQDGKTYKAGYYLDELEVPLRKLVDAGFEPIFANPKGNAASFDPESNNKMYYGNDEARLAAAVAYVGRFNGIRHPKTLTQVLKEGTAQYVGILVPGGYSPMQDLVKDKTLGDILLAFHANGRPTGLICHGPAVLASTLSDPVSFNNALAVGDLLKAQSLAGKWPYAGYRMTVISMAEERALEAMQLGGRVRVYPSDVLAQAGAHVDSVALFGSNVIEDRELVTAQQPMSAEAFGEAFLKKLQTAVAR